MSITIAFKQRLAALLRQGLAPGPLALAFACGATIGVMPSPWGSSLLCFVLAARLGLNQAATQLANYAAWPLQFVLFVPFFSLGQLLFGAGPETGDISALVALFQQDPAAALGKAWLAWGKALAAWGLLTPLLVVLQQRIYRRLLHWRGAVAQGAALAEATEEEAGRS